MFSHFRTLIFDSFKYTYIVTCLLISFGQFNIASGSSAVFTPSQQISNIHATSK